MSDLNVSIVYYIVPNKAPCGGWLPVYYMDGKQYGSTYSGHTYSEDDAWKVSEADAHECASRFCGDYIVTVTARK